MLRPLALFALVASLPTCGDAGPEAELARTVIQGDATQAEEAEAAAGPEIPPLRPGELSPVAGSGSGLQVLYVAPQGEEREPSQVAVVFDRPMVPLSGLDQAVPVSCTPAIAGRARWAGTSTAVIVPEGYRMKAATAYSCSVPQGTAAADGTALDHEVRFEFATERPALRRSWPGAGSSQWKPEDPIVLRFNQAVDPGVVARSLALADAAGRTLPIEVHAGSGEHASADTVEVRGRLQRGTTYSLTLAAGLTGSEGPLGSAQPTTLKFSTYPMIAVESVSPEGAVSPEEGLRIQFSTPVSAKEVAAHLSMTPPPPDGWSPGDAYTSRYWSYYPRLLPRTSYTLTLSPGIKDEYGQEMKEGRSWTFTTGDLSPTIDVPAGDQDLYAANNPSELPIRVRNVSRVDARVERLDPMALLGQAESDAWRELPATATSAQTLAGSAARNVGSTSMIDLTPGLVNGYGLLRLTTSAPEYRNWDDEPWVFHSFLQVTDLGTTLKLMPDGAMIWVTRLSDASAVAGAEVTLARGGKPVWSGQTDADGIALATGDLVPDDWSEWGDDLVALVRSGDDASITRHAWRDGLRGWEREVWEDFSPRQDRVSIKLFSDRGVYRTGDEVHVALLARTLNRELLAPPKGKKLTWTFTGPEGQTLASGDGVLDASGAFAFDVVPPADGVFGNYGLRAEIGEDTAYLDIPVRAYRAPSFRVDVALPPLVPAGSKLEATVNARYLFGAPMGGQAVQWSVRRRPLEIESATFPAFSFRSLPTEDEWYTAEPSEESVSSGKGKLGADGTYTIAQAVQPTDVQRPWTYLAEAIVTDTDRQQLSGRAETAVHSADVYPGVRTLSWLGTVGSPAKVEVVAVDPTGAPQGGTPVEVAVLRRTWDSIQERGMDGYYHWVSTPKDSPVGSAKVTSADTPTPWSFVPDQAGYYLVRLTTKDKQGRAAVAEADLYVAGADVAWARGDDLDLPLVADKARYEPGDTARILVKAPRPNLGALVTVEREGVFSRKFVRLRTTADAVEIPVTPEMMPNAFVNVMIAEGAAPQTQLGAGKPGVWFGQVEIEVDPKGQRGEVLLSTDRTSYQPREEVKLSLQASRGGKPMANAHVVLWAVDYGVLSLTAYERPDLHAAFYQKRPLGVITADNRLSVWDRAARLGKGAPLGGGGGYEVDVRTKFETTPLWLPSLKTDASGKLETSFPLPDNLTTFKIMAVVDEGPSFAGGETEIRVSRPLIARPALPRFFRFGDRALAGVVLHNNTEAALSVAVEAEATGATLAGAPRTVQVGAGEAKEVPFAITDFSAAEVKFHFDAKGGSHADAVELAVPVSPVVVTDTVASAGTTTGEATETIAIPEGAIASAGGLSVDLSASALVGMGSAVDYVVDYPHGCLEQTGSRVRVALLARRLGERAGVRTAPEKLDEIVKVGLERMRRFHVPGGGVSYWPGGDEVSGPATTYALTIYAEAKAAGYPVASADLDALAGSLRRFLGGAYVPRWWSEGVKLAAWNDAATALARSGRGDPAFNQQLWAKKDLLPLAARAQMMETLARTAGRDPRVGTLGKELEAAVHVEATRAALEDPDDSRWSALWYGAETGTANLVRALLVANPEHSLVPRLVQHLVSARSRGRWTNTYVTASTLAALAEYVQRFERGGVAAELSLAGKTLVSGDLGTSGSGQVVVPMAALQPGPLLVRSSNGGRLYYEARLAYSLPRAPARDEGFTLTRDLAVIEGTGAGREVTPGAMVRVTLRVVTPIDRFNVALVDSLPAGLEPVDSFFATTRSDLDEDEGNRDTAGGEMPQWWSTWVFDRREIRDEEMRFYATYMPAGIHTVSYLARATTPGDYASPGARVEEMYAPETYGRTEAGRFVVGYPVARR